MSVCVYGFIGELKSVGFSEAHRTAPLCRAQARPTRPATPGGLVWWVDTGRYVGLRHSASAVPGSGALLLSEAFVVALLP